MSETVNIEYFPNSVLKVLPVTSGTVFLLVIPPLGTELIVPRSLS